MVVNEHARQTLTDRSLAAQGQRLQKVGRETSEILNSRIWRTLVKLGGLALYPFSRQSPEPLKRPASAPVRDEEPARLDATPPTVEPLHFQLNIDDPSPTHARPLSGTIKVRGWMISSEPVDRLEVETPGLPRVDATMRLPRPDVQRAFPDMPNSGRAGFPAEIYSSPLNSGVHQLSV